MENQDKINPSYYKDLDPEPIEVIEKWQLDYHLASVLGYIARAGWKEGAREVDDLRKARWFIDRKIQMLEAEEDYDLDDTGSDLGSGVDPLTRQAVDAMRENSPNWFEKLLDRARNI